jgi:hypothetical protein
VSLSCGSVNFGDALIGTVVLRSITIENSTNTPAFYQFLTESNSIFQIDKPWGTINACSVISLTLKFSATEAINYYRRIYCIVENQDGLVIIYFSCLVC